MIVFQQSKKHAIKLHDNINISTAIDDRGVLPAQKSDFIKEKHLQH